MFSSVIICALILALSRAEAWRHFVQRPLMESSIGIVGGDGINISKAPYQVSLESYGRHTCGGSILNEHFILTAAHCTGRSADALTVRTGSSAIGNGGQVIQVKAVHRHSKYDSRTFDYDFCVLELKEKIVFDKTKKAIQLPKLNTIVKDGEILTVSGWGSTRYGHRLSERLRAVQVPKVNERQCNDVYGNFIPVTERMVCAGYIEGGKDSCQGDSGGPLVDPNQTLVGVVSWGFQCAVPNYPGVYGRVASVIDWIEKIIKKSD